MKSTRKHSYLQMSMQYKAITH